MKSCCETTKKLDIFVGSVSDTASVNLYQKVEDNSILGNLPAGAVKAGDNVVVIGSSVANTTYLMAQLAQNEGKVLVIENEEKYLKRTEELSSKFEKELGFANWQFVKSEMDDFKTNPSAINAYLAEHPANNFDAYKQFEATVEEQRSKNPLIKSESVDVVVLDMTLNRLQSWKFKKVLKEAFRILRPAGRIITSVMLSDEPIPEVPNLPEGCTLNVGLEKEVFEWLYEAGFYGSKYSWQENSPVKVINGIEIRTFIVEGFRPKQVVCMDYGDAVIYPGPWREVYDDDGHKYVRGERMALCAKTFAVVNNDPYVGQFIYVPSYVKVPDEEATRFDCDTPQIRDPKVTKGIKSTQAAKLNSSESIKKEPCPCEQFENVEEEKPATTSTDSESCCGC